VQQASDKASQLIEIVRPGDMYISFDRDFITLGDLANAEDHLFTSVLRSGSRSPFRQSEPLRQYRG
jgi:hypothetical protein